MFRHMSVFFLLCIVFVSPFADAAVIGAPNDQQTVNADLDTVITTVHIVDDIHSGADSSSPYYLTVYNGALYFSANGTNDIGTELWNYTPDHGAHLVADIWSGPSGSHPAYLTLYNDALYFRATGNDGAGTELWNYTPAGGARRVTDIYSGSGSSNPGDMRVYNGALYFQAYGNDGAGTELWNYTPAGGARRVADIYSGSGSSYPSDLAVYNGALYFSANGHDGAGYELWKYTLAGGARRVEDITSGSDDSYLESLTVYNGSLYFHNYAEETGDELWKYDPVNGADIVADISSGTGGSSPGDLVVYNGALYFRATGYDKAGAELWKYDPVNGADRVADIWTGSESSIPQDMAVFNGALYFQADGNNGFGKELWLYSNSNTGAFHSAKSLDGWVLESGENSNTGGTLNADAATLRVGDDAGNKQYISILSFDTSSLPDTSVVTSAILKVHGQGVTGTNPFATLGNIKLDIRNGPFSGNSSLQAEDFQAAASRSGIGTITTAHDAENWYSSGLISSALGSVNPKGITQLRLRFKTDDDNDATADYLRFSSGNAAYADRPILEVTYYQP
jgi:ELWxxDGT repeat protein